MMHYFWIWLDITCVWATEVVKHFGQNIWRVHFDFWFTRMLCIYHGLGRWCFLLPTMIMSATNSWTKEPNQSITTTMPLSVSDHCRMCFPCGPWTRTVILMSSKVFWFVFTRSHHDHSVHWYLRFSQTHSRNILIILSRGLRAIGRYSPLLCIWMYRVKNGFWVNLMCLLRPTQPDVTSLAILLRSEQWIG